MFIPVQDYSDICVLVMLRYKVMLLVNYQYEPQVYNVDLCKCCMFNTWLLISVYRSR